MPVIVVSGTIWVGLSILVGMLALRRRQSGLLFFVLALVTSPLVALVILLIVASNSPTAHT